MAHAAALNKVRHIVVVGCGTVGKTWLLHRFHDEQPPCEYLATVYEKSEFQILVDDESYLVQLHDTAGQEAYDRLRKVVYPLADAFLLCYDVSNRATFLNATLKWVEELRQEQPTVPIVLCATKIDLRKKNLSDCVTPTEGEFAAKEMNANGFVETSAVLDINVKEAFYEAVRASIVGVPKNDTNMLSYLSICCCLKWCQKGPFRRNT